MHSAWEPIEDIELKALWDKFYSDFDFNPSIDKQCFPGIKEPSPFVTYSIEDIYGDEKNYNNFNQDLQKKFLSYFQTIVPKNQWLYSLDWQHPCYHFFPDRPFDLDEFDEWPVPILPNGDYYIFLEPSFKYGVFGHPWEQTMCIFGNILVDVVQSNPPLLFKKPIRRG